MIHVQPVMIDSYTCIAIDVSLPKTRLLVVQSESGYIMCGALDIALLNEKLADRHIIAARAVGVRTIEELLAAPLESVTLQAQSIGVVPGMSGYNAMSIICSHEEKSA